MRGFCFTQMPIGKGMPLIGKTVTYTEFDTMEKATGKKSYQFTDINRLRPEGKSIFKILKDVSKFILKL